jgi:UDP-N-acetyl-D-glucosamine dehydrogenase
VVYHDPYVESIQWNGEPKRSVALTDAEVAGADCVVVVTDHGNIDYADVVRRERCVVDTRNATRGIPGEHVVGLSGERRRVRAPMPVYH